MKRTKIKPIEGDQLPIDELLLDATAIACKPPKKVIKNKRFTE